MTERHLAEGEEVVARLAPHARALVAPIVATLVVAGLAAYLWGVLPERWMSDVAAGVGVLVLVVGAVPPVVRWASTSYLLTSRRVAVRSGALARHRREVLLARVGEVAVRRRGAQAIAGSGDVLVYAGGDPVVLADVPRPRLVQAAILELVEAAAARYGDDGDGAGRDGDRGDEPDPDSLDDPWDDTGGWEDTGDWDDTGGWEDVHTPDR